MAKKMLVLPEERIAWPYIKRAFLEPNYLEDLVSRAEQEAKSTKQPMEAPQQ
jgi:hypothetical protein